MKSSLRSAADFIFVMYLSIYLTGCRSIESYRPYDPDLDSYALESVESVTLTDGTVINLNEYSYLKIIKDAKSRNAISYERYDTAWDNSHKNFTVTSKVDTVSFDEVRLFWTNEVNTGGTVAVIGVGVVVAALAVVIVLLTLASAIEQSIFLPSDH